MKYDIIIQAHRSLLNPCIWTPVKLAGYSKHSKDSQKIVKLEGYSKHSKDSGKIRVESFECPNLLQM